jgi:hypothetical protein
VPTKEKRADPAQSVIARVDRAEAALRVAAKELMSQAAVTQAGLAEAMGVSQPAVSHMLGNRTYGLTVSEIIWIETVCRASPGTIYMMSGVFYDATAPGGSRVTPPPPPPPPSLEEQIYGFPGIAPQAADAIVAAIQAVRANAARQLTAAIKASQAEMDAGHAAVLSRRHLAADTDARLRKQK